MGNNKANAGTDNRRIIVSLPDGVYDRPLDICAGKGCTINEWMTEKVNREWVNRSRIMRRDFEGRDRAYLEKHAPKGGGQ